VPGRCNDLCSLVVLLANLICKSGGPLAYDAGGGSYTLGGVVSTGTATTGGNTPICGGSGYGVYVSVSKNAAWLNGALSGDTAVAGQPITSGTGGKAAIPTSIPWYYWGIPAIVVGLGLLILIIVCCVRSGKSSAERRHQANVRRAAPPPVKVDMFSLCLSLIALRKMIPTPQVLHRCSHLFFLSLPNWRGRLRWLRSPSRPGP
jgi:hypothetical protein